MSDLVFSFPVRIYYEDTDAGGVVYHANYLKFMERARSEVLIEAGCSVVRCEQEFGVLFVVSKMDITFASPAKLGQDLLVETKVIKLGKVGLVMQQDIYTEQRLLICSALVKLAVVVKTDSGHYSVGRIPELLSGNFESMMC